MSTPLDLMIDSYRAFRARGFERDKLFYQKLADEGQQPKVAMVACSDSRVDPAIVLQTNPGEVFTIRNVANLVPPYEEQGTFHGTSAALEFAVTKLEVEDLVILGHAHCGGVKALVERDSIPPGDNTFISRWMSMAVEAVERVDHGHPHLDGDDRYRACEQSCVLVSLDNLMTFPWIAERVTDGRLRLHGWYFNLAEGELQRYDTEKKAFEPI